MTAVPHHLQRRIPHCRMTAASRGYLLAWTVWSKADMMGWLILGATDALTPEDASLLFVFDSCDDDSVSQYWRYRQRAAHAYHFLPPIVNEGHEWFEGGCHNAALLAFLPRPEFHTLVVFQDDMQVRSGAFLDGLDRLRAEHGDRLGVVGGRDGFGGMFEGPVSAGNHHALAHARVLEENQFAGRPLSNRGPVVYPRRVAEAVGMIDQAMPQWYGENDYCARAHKAGFVNGVMGWPALLHKAFGTVRASTLYQGQQEAQLAAYNAKHPDLRL